VSELVVQGIHKRLGGNEILKGISFELKAGEVLALLGHSGSGKTTILRSVAGLERPDAGAISIGGKTVFDAERGIDTPPEKRNLGLVFQSYALWPNRTVSQNVAYGLKLRDADRADIEVRVKDILERLGLGDLGSRYPHQLSGGQQQRVALARALVYRPKVLLLDEPLSNLDAKLREEARGWLRALIVDSRISALYVTHDQVEAMAIADRMFLLHLGQVEQEGTPQEVYGQPRSSLSADFMGSNNCIKGILGAIDGERARLDFAGGSLYGRLIGRAVVGAHAAAYIRIERTHLVDGAGPGRLAMKLETALYLGERWEYALSCEQLRVRAWGPAQLPMGSYWVSFTPDDLWIF